MPALSKVLDATDLFPSELLKDMIAARETGDGTLWLTADDDGEPCGFCVTSPEALAEGTWNMLAIAVLPDRQGTGIGKALVAHTETLLQQHNARILIVDTSGTPEFAATRRFYLRSGFDEEARIRDFWGPSDDKVVFWKAMR